MTKCSSTIPSKQCQYIGNNGNENNIDVDKYCLSEKDNKIYKSSNGSCNIASQNFESTEKSSLFRKSKNGFEKAVYGDSSVVIYSCDETTGCTQLLSANKNFIYNGNNYFYKCEANGLCNKHTPNVGFYVDGMPNETYFYTNLINCTTLECINVATPNAGYYINAETPGQVIHCKASEGCNILKNEANNDEEVYYINSSDGTNQKVFYCNTQLCSNEMNTGMLYRTGRNIKGEEIILCGEKCRYTTFINSCKVTSDNGNVYYDKGKNNIRLCSAIDENVHWIDISMENTNHTIYYTFPPSLIQDLLPDIKDSIGNIVQVNKRGLYLNKNPDYGYYISDNDFSYIRCDQNGCQEMDKILNTCEDDNSIGKIAKLTENNVEHLAICTHLNGRKRVILKENDEIFEMEKGFPGTVDSNALVYVGPNGVRVQQGTFVDRDKNDNPLNSLKRCNTNSNTHIYECFNEVPVKGEYYCDQYLSGIYYANGKNLEKMIYLLGYYMNSKEIIYYALDSSIGDCKTIPISSLNNSTKCTTETIGKFINPDSPSLCLDENKMINLTEESSGSYMLSYSDGNYLGLHEDQQAKITVSNNKAVIDKIESSDSIIQYILNKGTITFIVIVTVILINFIDFFSVNY